MEKKKQKIIRVNEELHHQLKVEAVERDITLQALLEEKLCKTKN
jgi:predicted HicB family RNase H-like nuclease